LTTRELIRRIGSCARIAAVLEVSGWPKPGNVHRTIDHPDARYEHFLVGSIALGHSCEDAALRGVMAASKTVEISEIQVGRFVRKAVSDIVASHSGGNTHLGTCLLFVPLAAAAAKTTVETGEISVAALRRSVREIMNSTTSRDAVDVYEAITSVSSFHELGRAQDVRAPDLYDREAKKRILSEGITLLDAMEQSSSYDTVARELITGMEISFEVGYKELTGTYNTTHNINTATVHTFLRILSKTPDTFIARKVGLKSTSNIMEAVQMGRRETMWISETAKQILEKGGLTTEEGKAFLWELDEKLQSLGKDYSPGTTADLTAAALMIGLLNGLKF